MSEVKTVVSKDGTSIAYDVAGSGPALVLVDGALCDREMGPMPDLSTHLQDHFTVYNYDRRGRGDSGDTRPYAVEREVEDLAALIEAAGGSAFVFGTSSGGALTLRAAISGLPMTKFAVYETPYLGVGDRAHPPDMVGDLDRFVAAGDTAGAVRYFLVDMVGLPPIATVFMRAMPKVWNGLRKIAPTLPNDARMLGTDFRPDIEALAEVAIPSLVMNGSKAAKWMSDAVQSVAKALPKSSYKVLPKQTHQVKSAVLAPELIAFFSA